MSLLMAFALLGVRLKHAVERIELGMTLARNQRLTIEDNRHVICIGWLFTMNEKKRRKFIIKRTT